MEEGVQIIVDIEPLKVCRLCIRNKGKFQVVKRMRRSVKEFFGISINSCDGMSQVICKTCKKLLTEILKLRKRFKKNQEILTQKCQTLMSDDDKTLAVIAGCNSELSSDSKKEETSDELKVKEVVQNQIKPNIENEDCSKIKINVQKNTPSKPPITISLDSESGDSSKESSNNAKHSRLKSLLSDSEDSDDDNIKLNVLQKSFKYVCCVCDDSFDTKTKMNSHITSEHNRLYKSVLSQCTPCSVPLDHVLLMKQKPNEWVRLKPSKILKFSPSDPLYYVVKCGKPKVIIESSSSDSDSSVSKTNKYPQIMSKPEVRVTKRTKASKSLEKLAPRESMIRYPIVCVNSDSDSSATPPEDLPDNGVAYKADLTAEEVRHIIEDCFAVNKGLTNYGDWFIRDMKEHQVLKTNWINSETFRISKSTSAVKQMDNDDILSQLPIYSSWKLFGCLGHRKLEKAPPPKQKSDPLVSDEVVIVEEQRPLARKSPPTAPPLAAFKRSVPSLDDIPNKKKSTEQLNPIIVSTVSLAKTCEPSTVGQPPANNKPVILCKPTCLLMPSPIKEIVNTTIHNPYNVNQPDTVPGSSRGMNQQNGQLSSIENNQNNISILLNFDGYNMTVNSEQNANIVILNNSQQQSAPQVLNNPIMVPVEMPPLISSSNFYQNDQSQNYATPANAAQKSSCQYSIVEAVGSKYVDVNDQFSLTDLNIPDKDSVLTQLIHRCKRNNVILKTSLSMSTKYYKLLRFVLTIQEKQCDTRILLSSEFIVEVCLQYDGVFVFNVNDQSKAIDLMKWSNEFQTELINALKKPQFAYTMRQVGKNYSFAQKVDLFTNILEKFEAVYS